MTSPASDVKHSLKFHSLAWVNEIIAFFLLWLMYVGKVSKDECLAGVCTIGLTIIGTNLAASHARLHFHPKLSWLLQVWRLPSLIMAGTWVLARRLAQHMVRKRPPKGLFLAVPFRYGGADPRSVARRALAVFYTTLPPNFVIIDVDPKAQLMLFHQVRRDPVPEVTRILGAK